MRPELDAAVAAVKAAQKAIAEGGGDRITSKGGRDLVTDADFAAEDAIRSVLCERYPTYPVVGEERGGKPPADGTPYWLVDPICGTRAFASGIPLYAINVALAENGEPVLAAVGDGSSGAIYVAEHGNGSWARDRESTRLSVSDESLIVWVEPTPASSPESGPSVAEFSKRVILANRWWVWSCGTSLAAAYLASGRIAGLVEFHVSGLVHWTAGCLLCKESGAIVTDHEGRPWTMESHTLVASASPTLHGNLLDLIQMAPATEE